MYVHINVYCCATGQGWLRVVTQHYGLCYSIQLPCGSYHVLHHMSCIICVTSCIKTQVHVARNKTRDAICNTCDAICNTCDARNNTCDARHNTCDARHNTCDARHNTCDARHNTCDSRYTYHTRPIEQMLTLWTVYLELPK